MYQWITETVNSLRSLQDSKISEIANARRQDLLLLVQGTIGRSGLDTDPNILATTHPAWLQARFDHKPGYALFENSPYHIRFEANQPIITPLTFKEKLSGEALSQIQKLFPFEPEPLKTSIDEELNTLTAAISHSIKQPFSFNSTLLRSYFAHPSDTPFIPFSSMVCIQFQEDKSNQYKFIQTLVARHEKCRNVPILLSHPGGYVLYGNTNGNQWSFTELDQNILKKNLQAIMFTEEPYILEYQSKYFSMYDHIIAKKAHTHFSTQPQQITQIQKIINGLFYVEQAFKYIEEEVKLDMSTLKKVGSGEYKIIYEHAHAALSSFSDLDIDFAQRFKEEIVAFNYFLTQFNEYSDSSPQPDIIAPDHQEHWAFQFGQGVGFITRYIYDPEGKFDFQVLSQLSADFPKHIDTITTLLNTHLSDTPQYAPNINAQQLKALQQEATKLLNTLKNTQAPSGFGLNPFYQIYQIINYAFLIRQVIILLDSTVTQIGFLNNASQKSIRSYLKILNEHLFPRILALAGQIEIELVLEPGTFSQPLMQKINEYYNLLINQTKNIANFSFIGLELLTIENQQVLRKRLAYIYDFMNNSKKNILQINEVISATNDFFSESPLEQTKKLSLYAMIAPHLKQLNPEAHNAIIHDLNQTRCLGRPERDLIKNRVLSYCTTIIETEQLRLKQCGAVMKTIHDDTTLTFLPYNTRVGYDIALQPIKSIKNLRDLPLSQQYPILIQQKIKSETKYMVYGNTDGTKWDFTPIEEQFIPRFIITQFNRLKPHQSKQNLNELYILRYHQKYHLFYEELNLHKAHTHYQSQFDCMESELFAQTNDVIKPIKHCFNNIDWFRRQLGQTLPQKSEETQSTQPTPTTPLFIYLDQRNTHFQHLETLTSDQAFTLHLWYKDKIRQYKEARNNLKRFKTLLNQYFTSNDMIVFEPQLKLHQEYKRLYHALQPYLIGMRNFPEFDKKMIAALSFYPDPNSLYKLGVQEFHDFLQSVSLDNDKKRVHFWQKRSKNVLDYAKKAMFTELNQIPPALTTIENTARSEFIFKNEQVSKTLTTFITSLKKWIPLLKPRIQEELRSNTTGTPYPDIYELNSALKETPFVLFFKRLFNTLYHLEQAAKQIESLKIAKNTLLRDNNIHSLIALWQNHGQHLISLGPKLYADPIIAAMSESIQAQYTAVLPRALNLLQPHTPNVINVQPVGVTAQSSGLWYTLNSFYITPTHLLALTEQSDPNMGHTIFLQTQYQYPIQQPAAQRLTLIQHDGQYTIYGNGLGQQWALRPLPRQLIEELNLDFSVSSLNYDKKYQALYDYLVQENCHTTEFDSLQKAAKQTTKNIEYIIEHSNSYLKLFLSSWMIYRLNSEIRAKLQTFTQTTQSVAMSQLNSLYSTYFTPILLKADLWEHRLGVLAGTITLPLKKIIDEWYKGFVSPLKLKFQEKEDLVCENGSITKRIHAEDERLQLAHAQLKESASNISLIKHFIEDIKEFKNSWLLSINNLVEQYATTVLPLLESHQQQCHIQKLIPEWIKNITPELSSGQLPDIEQQVDTYLAYLLGLQTTHQLSYANSLEKLKHLKELKTQEEQSSRSRYRRSYATHYLHAYLNHLPRHKLKLSHKNIHQEYHYELQQHIMRQQNELFEDIEHQTDIDQHIASKIKSIEETFEKTYFSRYERLDKIQTAIEQFQAHLERDKRIAPTIKQRKSDCLKAMHAMFENTDQVGGHSITHLNSRLTTLISMINASEATLLAPHVPTYTHCLDWLLDCMISLFTAIGLYTPERQQRYQDLVRASSIRDCQSDWLSFFGSHTTPQRPQRSAIATPGQGLTRTTFP
ncbi:MAG: hypothetical protein CK424_02060 [Legionella sp.]|nr:MAG: hypothetical protein CK424_02060 [Legionella sp.]